jgi:hypothetical protein
MRKFILVAAFVLVSATAQAGASRGLTMASSDDPAAAGQASEAAKAAETPKYAKRPAAADATTQRSKAGRAKLLAAKDARLLRAGKPKPGLGSIVVARAVHALHRHGIYW